MLNEMARHKWLRKTHQIVGVGEKWGYQRACRGNRGRLFDPFHGMEEEKKNQQKNLIKLMIERGGEWKGGKDIFTSLLFHFLVHSHMTFVMIFWSFFSFFYFPTLAWSQRGDYLWGQHRIREKQGSSGDFAKNDHNNDVDDNDDSELMLVVSH